MKGFEAGAEVFIVANGLRVRPVKIIEVIGGLYTLQFLDRPGATRLKRERLFRTKEEAETYINKGKPKKPGYRSPYSYGYY